VVGVVVKVAVVVVVVVAGKKVVRGKPKG